MEGCGVKVEYAEDRVKGGRGGGEMSSLAGQIQIVTARKRTDLVLHVRIAQDRLFVKHVRLCKGMPRPFAEG